MFSHPIIHSHSIPMNQPCEEFGGKAVIKMIEISGVGIIRILGRSVGGHIPGDW